MHTTRYWTLTLAAVLTLMGDGISTTKPVVSIPDDPVVPTAALPAQAAPAAPVDLTPPTDDQAGEAATWLAD